MALVSKGELNAYEFELLADVGVVQELFTRRGGVSRAPWESLNVGGTVGDDPAHVAENRLRCFMAAGRNLKTLFDVWQVHSATVVCTDTPRPLERKPVQADIILTDRPEITLFMRFADCVPILLVDPLRHVIGLAHAGWQGTVKRVPAVAVEAMRARYGCRPEDILAGIGPAIGTDHYAVGPEVVEQVQAAFGADASGLFENYAEAHAEAHADANAEAIHLNLWEANRVCLERSGVKHIQVAEICTACHLEDWFSHRGDKGKTGRFGAILGLR